MQAVPLALSFGLKGEPLRPGDRGADRLVALCVTEELDPASP